MKTHNGNILSLKANQVFVFGSNLAGIHGAGAAKLATECFGAELGVGEGLTGQCYAIPTKDLKIQTLDLKSIEKSVFRFIEQVKLNAEKEFLLTEIGCGLAGLKVREIAPMFSEAKELKNIVWPIPFV